MRVVDDSVRLQLDELEALFAAEPDETVATIREQHGDLLRAVAEPLVEVRCLYADATVLADHRMWARPEGAALLLQGADEHQLSGLHPTALPALLARLIGLGPRRERREPREVAPTVLDDLLCDDDVRRWSAIAAVGAEHVWSVSVVTADGERTLSGVDGEAGLAVLEESDHGPVLVPSTSTEVFRLLTTVLF